MSIEIISRLCLYKSSNRFPLIRTIYQKRKLKSGLLKTHGPVCRLYILSLGLLNLRNRRFIAYDPGILRLIRLYRL